MDWTNMQWHDYVWFIISLVGVLIIIWGVVKGLREFVSCEYQSFRNKTAVPVDEIRYDVGRYLLLGLEFLIAADIVHTVIQPGLEEVAVLAAIVIIRTIISYFLNREMAQAVKHDKNKIGGKTT
jgi:uncharacterized membrane protein